jgi:hypothetical protein
MKNLDIGKDVRFIFCDISKAFDHVWHRGLLYKLRKYGIKGNLLTWFGSTKAIQIRIQGFSGFILIINNTIKGCIVSK